MRVMQDPSDQASNEASEAPNPAHHHATSTAEAAEAVLHLICGTSPEASSMALSLLGPLFAPGKSRLAPEEAVPADVHHHAASASFLVALADRAAQIIGWGEHRTSAVSMLN